MYTLKRLRDGLTKVGLEIGWVEWNEDGRGEYIFDEPAVGRSLMLDPHIFEFTWLTTSITEIVEQREGYIKFATKNSIYELITKQTRLI